MKHTKRLCMALITTLVLCYVTGCTTPGTEIDRDRDTRDIFTFTTAKGHAFKLRLGPAQVGVVYPPRQYEAGLRGGEFYKPYKWDFDEYLIFHGNDRFCGTELTKTRGKSFEAKSMGCFAMPQPWKPKLYDDKEHSMEQERYPWSYYTQTEIVLGVFTRWRLGINWGELADFAFGWCNLDIYGDDLKIKAMMDIVREAEKEEEEQPVIIDLSKALEERRRQEAAEQAPAP